MTWGLWRMDTEYVVLILTILSVLLILYGLHSFIRQRLDYYSSLGARVVGRRYLIVPVAEIEHKNTRVEIYTEGLRGRHRLTLKVDVSVVGYIRLWKGDWLDRLFMQERYEGLFVEYEDQRWAKTLLYTPELKRAFTGAFSELGVSFLNISRYSLTLGWNIKRSPKEVDREKVLKAVEYMVEMKRLLEKMPSSAHYKEELRRQLTLKVPILITLFLTLWGLAGGFYRYNPVCPADMLFVGFKILFPIVLAYIGFVLLLVGGATLGQRVILNTFFVCLVCGFFITLFFLTYINGILDTSQPQVKMDTISRKYHSFKRGYRLSLAQLHREKWLCDSFNVSEKFYNMARVGDKVMYSTKRGFLGVEWLYAGLTLVR